jgi:hypothetical protein
MADGVLRNKLSLVILGLIFGILIYLGPSIILSILVLWSIFSFISSRPQSEKIALKRIVGLALILRVLFFSICIFIVYVTNNIDLIENPVISKVVGHTVQLIRDFDREIKNGIQIARYLRGEFGDVPVGEVSHHGFGFLHIGAWIQGLLNFAFGASVFNLLLFPLIDLWAVIIVYYVGKLQFDKPVAAFASFIYAIMPSIIIISCTNIRFSLSILSFLLIGLSLLKFSRTNNLKFLFMLMVSIILFMIFREKGAKPLLMITPFILIMALNLKFRVKSAALITVAFLFIISLNKSSLLKQKFDNAIQDIISKQIGFVNTAQGNIYKIYDDLVYRYDIKGIPTSTLIKMLPRGLLKGFIYFMFAPFLWEVTNVSRFYAYPQILFWYFMVPFAILGIMWGLIVRTKETLPIILLSSYFIVLLSLTMGNEGIAMRFRELIAPFFYIFAGSILCRFIAPAPKGES